jgi:geranylgeranyl diphosphate synthase type II
MDIADRVERALRRHLAGRDRPKKLGTAMHHALFPGGARVRPSFALRVALACGDDRPAVADALAAALEYLHCASLVHDDLPCFDDAQTRRGQPAVHIAHGEAMAVLAGDGLIVLAFQALADVAADAGERLAPLLSIVAESAGTPSGLVGGQALEAEDGCDIGPYHAAKTGALFAAAAAGGAAAAGADSTLWRPVGEALGAAYQIADDLHDHVGANGALGKPTGQDSRLGRPNAVALHGLDGALSRLRATLDRAADSVPESDGAPMLRQMIRAQTERFVPKTLHTAAA